MTEIVGILNLTRDSFSDGGRYLDPDAACARAHELAAAGAAWIDVGAESTRPEAEEVPAELELRRLEPVVTRLLDAGLAVSVDTWKPDVMARVLAMGVRMINDVRALRTPGAVEAVRASDAKLVLMHSVSAGARAERGPAEPVTAENVVERVLAFFRARLAALAAAGIAPERVIVDPGLGFFLAPDPRPSFAMLRELPRLRALGRPIYVCPSRKSFLGALTGRAVGERGAATLAAELHAWSAGADYVRTHDVRALADGIRVLSALR